MKICSEYCNNMAIKLPLVLLCCTLGLVVAKKPKSKSIDCPPLPYANIVNGSIVPLSNDRFKFRCDSGYFLGGPEITRCFRGRWTYTKEPKCFKAEGQCDDPPKITNGVIHGDDKGIGSSILYMCHPGYLLIGDGIRRCLESGFWSGITPACISESEPLEKIAQRFHKQFLRKIGSFSNSSIGTARLLDRNSILRGLEIIILFDRSSSVDPVDFETGKEFIKFLLKEFGVKNGNNTSGTRAAVIAFGTKVDLVFNVNNNSITGPDAANDALDAVQPGGGGTAMVPAMEAIFRKVDDFLRNTAKKAVFLITDGEPNVGSPMISPQDIASSLLKEDYEIFTVGIGKGINRRLLAEVASEPILNHVFILDEYDDLRKIMKTIQNNTDPAPPISPDKCGYLPENQKDKWPWLAALYLEVPAFVNKTVANESVIEKSPRLALCSGVLICRQWVLTAASCFYQVHQKDVRLNIQEVFVVLGENHLVLEDEHQINFYAEDVRIHPKFDPLSDLIYNLAVVKLNMPAPLKRFRPICLPPTDLLIPLHLDLNINTTIVGWGSLQTNVGSNEISGATVNLNLTSYSVALEEEQECFRFRRPGTRKYIFCAGLGSKSCIGDFGSPIIAIDPGTNLYHVLGILSRKTKCNQGINEYTELTNYIKWINEETSGCHLKHWIS